MGQGEVFNVWKILMSIKCNDRDIRSSSIPGGFGATASNCMCVDAGFREEESRRLDSPVPFTAAHFLHGLRTIFSFSSFWACV